MLLLQFIKRREFELQQQQKMEGNLVFYIWFLVTLTETIKFEYVVVWLEKLGLKIFGVEMFSNPVVTTIIHRIVFLHPKNDNGDTPFHLAANNGHTQGNQL